MRVKIGKRKSRHTPKRVRMNPQHAPPISRVSVAKEIKTKAVEVATAVARPLKLFGERVRSWILVYFYPDYREIEVEDGISTMTIEETTVELSGQDLVLEIAEITAPQQAITTTDHLNDTVAYDN